MPIWLKREQERRRARLAQRFGRIDFLAPLGAEVLSGLAGRVHAALYGRGEQIVREGEPDTDLYVIDRGHVAVMVDGGGKPREIARLGPGDFFGEMSLMTGDPRRATVVALGDVETVRVDRELFRDVLARDPRVVDEIGRVLAARQQALDADTGAAEAAEPAVERRSRALVNRIRGFFGL